MGTQNQSKPQTSNDQRSNTQNPNNPAHKAAGDNRANQLNPNNAPTKGAAPKK
jgi:hypothetical protein